MRSRQDRHHFTRPAVTFAAALYGLLGGLLVVLTNIREVPVSTTMSFSSGSPSWPSFVATITLLIADLLVGSGLFRVLVRRRPKLAYVLAVPFVVVAIALLLSAYSQLFGGWHGGLLTKHERP